jgi:hypothetical protein
MQSSTAISQPETIKTSSKPPRKIAKQCKFPPFSVGHFRALNDFCVFCYFQAISAVKFRRSPFTNYPKKSVCILIHQQKTWKVSPFSL